MTSEQNLRHNPRDEDRGTQTPTATPESGRLHDPLCAYRQPDVGAYTTLAMYRQPELLPTT